ncbi:hypothetical protein T484DRAFT_1963921 [Baffinella frigidus]|nr:hypothetical protein T484DRAFT_1963921 [Cryptophyta sp. CCMP2293]
MVLGCPLDDAGIPRACPTRGLTECSWEGEARSEPAPRATAATGSRGWAEKTTSTSRGEEAGPCPAATRRLPATWRLRLSWWGRVARPEARLHPPPASVSAPPGREGGQPRSLWRPAFDTRTRRSDRGGP